MRWLQAKWKIFCLFFVFVLGFFLGLFIVLSVLRLPAKLIALRQEFDSLQIKLEKDVIEIYNDLNEMEIIIKELKNEIDPILEIVEIKEVDVTFYAPLDPNAIEGWDYEGDPNITASGEKVRFNDTIAAGLDIPFYTKVYIEGMGWYTVHDRGGLIDNNELDIAVFNKKNDKIKTRAVFFYPTSFQNERK
ncbi:MAG: hypothetical protein AB7V60_05490 [Candidatus Caldatribacteriota bacterium]